MPAYGLEAQYMCGKYVEPRSGEETHIAGLLLARLELERRVEREWKVKMFIDFIRVRIEGELCAFRHPTINTILDWSDVGCKDINIHDQGKFKVWIFCPEDVRDPQRNYTVVLDNVILPIDRLQVREKKRDDPKATVNQNP